MKNSITQNAVKKIFDPLKLQQDFPALQNIGTYLDTAFTGLMPNVVKSAHEAFLNERSLFSSIPNDKTILGLWLDKLEIVREKLAIFMGTKPQEIALTYCTGCGTNIAINGIDWKSGDNVVTDDLSYPTDIHVINGLKSKGVEVRFAYAKNGKIALEEIEKLIDNKTKALVVSHVSYINGFRHNLKRLADLIHEKNGYLIVDGTQSIGAIQVDLHKEQVDFFSCSPYKWMVGPPGVGFMYVREELLSKIVPDRIGWSSTENYELYESLESPPFWNHAKRFEYGTLNFEGIYALEASLDYLNGICIKEIEQHDLHLTKILYERLVELGVDVITPPDNNSPIVAFACEDVPDYSQKLKEQRIYITSRFWKQPMLRISPHFYSTEEDIAIFIDAYKNYMK
jgi:cysteine desulfurase / selenocysteine lyase